MITKKKALEMAMFEWTMRNGDWESDEDDWTLKDEVLQEKSHKCWEKNPASLLATMIYDGLFNFLDETEINKIIKKIGKDLWYKASIKLAIRDHDT